MDNKYRKIKKLLSSDLVKTFKRMNSPTTHYEKQIFVERGYSEDPNANIRVVLSGSKSIGSDQKLLATENFPPNDNT